MRMKHARTVLFSIVFNTFLSVIASDYASYANSWLHEHIVDIKGNLRIPQADLQQLCIMMASSRDRSRTTLAAQAPALNAMRMIWQEWANVAQTRMNPSHERPFSVDRTQRAQTMQDFWQAVDDQANTSVEYNSLVQSMVYGTALDSQAARTALTEARTKARVFMLQALADARVQLGILYDYAFNTDNKSSNSLDPVQRIVADVQALLEVCNLDELDQRTFNLSDFLVNYLPGLAVHTFIEADKLHNRISQEAWQALFTLQEIGNFVWHAIETTRSAYYQALLDALTTVA
jgi:hypothetical protein